MKNAVTACMQQGSYFDRVMAATLAQGTPLSSACSSTVKLSKIACKATADIESYLTSNNASSAVTQFKEAIASELMKNYVIDQCISCDKGSTEKVCEVMNATTNQVAPPNSNQVVIMFAFSGDTTTGATAAKKIALPAYGAATGSTAASN
jgi:hypothetical protein